MTPPLHAGHTYWIVVYPISASFDLVEGMLGQLGFQITQIVGPTDAQGEPYTTDSQGNRTLQCTAIWRGSEGAVLSQQYMWTCNQWPNSWPCGFQFQTVTDMSAGPPPAPPPLQGGFGEALHTPVKGLHVIPPKWSTTMFKLGQTPDVSTQGIGPPEQSFGPPVSTQVGPVRPQPLPPLPPTPTPTPAPGPLAPAPSSNTMYWVIGIGIVAVVGGVLVYTLTEK